MGETRTAGEEGRGRGSTPAQSVTLSQKWRKSFLDTTGEQAVGKISLKKVVFSYSYIFDIAQHNHENIEKLNFKEGWVVS